MKRDELDYLIQDIKLKEIELSDKYGVCVELSFRIKDVSLTWLCMEVNSIFGEHYARFGDKCDIRLRSTKMEITMFRHLFCLFAKEYGWGNQDIADYLGKKTHTFTLFGVRAIKNRIATKEELVCRYYELIKERLNKHKPVRK